MTEKCILDVDKEVKNHRVLKKYVWPRSDKEKLATHIMLVDLSNKHVNLTAIRVTNIIKMCVYGDKTGGRICYNFPLSKLGGARLKVRMTQQCFKTNYHMQEMYGLPQ